MASKNLQTSSAIQNNSVTLFSMSLRELNVSISPSPWYTADVDAAWSSGGNQPFPECSILKAKNDHWDHPHVNQGDRFLIPEIKNLSPWFLQKSLEKRICYGHRWQRYLTWGWRTHVKYKCLMDEHDFSLRKCAVAMIFAFRRGFYGNIFPSWRQKTCRHRRQYKIIQ